MDIFRILYLILSDGIPCILLALGVFLTFRILDFADMTAEGSMLIGGAACGLLIRQGAPALVATVVGMIAGGLCGFITGILNRVLKIPKLLSGIITMTASGTIALLLFGLANNEVFASEVAISADKTVFAFLDPKVFVGWQQVIVISAIVIVIMGFIYFFFGTEYGMAIRATGINERMAKAQGINTTVTTIFCVSISNAMIGLAGALICQENNGCNMTSSTGYLVVGLASILMGETIFGKRSFKNSLVSISLGAILYFTIYVIATSVFEMPSDMLKLFYAILIVIALCLPMIKEGILKLTKKLFKKKKPEVG